MKRIRIGKLFLFIMIVVGIIFNAVAYDGFSRPAYAQAPKINGNENQEVSGKKIKPEKGIDSGKMRSEKAGDLALKSVGESSAAKDIPEKVNPQKNEGEKTHAIDPHETKKSTKTSKVIFNFDDAELIEVIRTLAELLEINYMVDPHVSGKVTIHTAGELNRDDLFEVFFQILELNGLTAIKQDKVYRITSLKDASRFPVMSRVGQNMIIPPEERIIIQIIPLNFVSPKEVIKIITPFMSPEAIAISEENTNILVVVDKAANLSKIIRLVNVFDTDIFEKFSHRFYALQYGDAETIAGIIQKMLSSYGSSVESSVNLISIPRLNTLLVISSNPKVFDPISEFIKNYDVPSQSTEPGIYFYPVKNGRVSDIAGILNKVFTGKKDTKSEIKTTSPASPFNNPFAAKEKKEAAEQGNKSKDMKAQGVDSFVSSGTLKGEIRITEDESRNSLIIEATPADYQIIHNLLIQLDIMPRQVMIEVTIAQIQLDESTAMGVEWSYVKGDENLSTSLLKATMGDSGLNFTIGNPDRWTAALSALATENKVNILSNPSVLASNSMPATIDISQEIPIASSQYQYTTGEEPLLETSIEYRDTGIMLSVTPNINEHGLVTMDIDQEISEQATNVSVGGSDYPSFFKRSVASTLTVQSGQTIVIGGLIRETKSDGASGTPWFTDLPVLSFLFGKTSDSVSKTELIILISPYVIATPDDVDAVTQEFTNKLSALRLQSE